MIAENIREARKRKGWKPADLALRCADAGADRLTENAIENIESGRRAQDGRRRRDVTADELLVLAYVLDVAPVYLITGSERIYDEFPVTPALAVTSLEASNWMVGFGFLPGTDEALYVGSLPEHARASYAADADQALAALESLREDLLRRKAAVERMAAIRMAAFGLDEGQE